MVSRLKYVWWPSLITVTSVKVISFGVWEWACVARWWGNGGQPFTWAALLPWLMCLWIRGQSLRPVSDDSCNCQPRLSTSHPKDVNSPPGSSSVVLAVTWKYSFCSLSSRFLQACTQSTAECWLAAIRDVRLCFFATVNNTNRKLEICKNT